VNVLTPPRNALCIVVGQGTLAQWSTMRNIRMGDNDDQWQNILVGNQFLGFLSMVVTKKQLRILMLVILLAVLLLLVGLPTN